jgi:hypothetical protein
VLSILALPTPHRHTRSSLSPSCRRFHSPLYSLAPTHTHLSPTHSLTPNRLVSMFPANDESCLQAMYVFWTKYSHSQRYVNALNTYIPIHIKLNFIRGIKISNTALENQPTFESWWWETTIPWKKKNFKTLKLCPRHKQKYGNRIYNLCNEYFNSAYPIHKI